MAELLRTSCCGVRDFDGLLGHESPSTALVEIWHLFDKMDGAFILLTCPTDEPILRKVIKYASAHDLGSFVETPPRMNPNSGNRLRAVLFTPNKRKMPSWFNKKKEEMTHGLEIGDMVKNVDRNSDRYNLEGEITDMYHEEGRYFVEVKYGGDMGWGHGSPDDYKKVD